MSTSDGLDPYVFCRKMEKTRSMKEEKDGQVFIPRHSWHFPFIDNMIKVLSLYFYLNLACKQLCINRKNESTVIIIQIRSLLVLYFLLKSLTVLSSLKLFPHIKRSSTLLL